MTAMGHTYETHRGQAEAVDQSDPQYPTRRYPMGSAGMAEMGVMEMPRPDNTLPMMTGNASSDRLNGRNVHGH
jgi:manganese oxidase